MRAAREELRLSQTALGQRIGRTHAAISDIERGKTRIGLADLAHLAAILAKPLSYFTGEEAEQGTVAGSSAAALYRRGEADLLAAEEQRLDEALEGFKAFARRVARESGGTGR